MKKFITFLKGKKTYLVAITGVIVNGVVAMGYISPEVIPVVNTVLGFLGMATIRAGIIKK